MVVKILVLVVYSLLNDTTGYLAVLIIKGHQLSAVLRNTQMDVGEDGGVFVRGELLCDFLNRSAYLLYSLLCRFHIFRII